MARLVRHDAIGPAEIKPSDKSVWVCQCGLSKNLPLCDGSHKVARQNDTPGLLCVYDKTRSSVLETKPDA